VAAALNGIDAGNAALNEELQFLIKLGERFGIDVTSSTSDEAILTPLEPLTARETAMIELLLSGMRNREIAERLSTSEATVKWHLYNLYSKLGVNNRTAAIHRARALGLGSG
jgi:ATP/maltotriose-dependent transcriptional regulator MalT